MNDPMAAKSRMFGEIAEYARQRSADDLRSKYGPKPPVTGAEGADEEAPTDELGLAGLDEETLRALADG